MNSTSYCRPPPPPPLIQSENSKQNFWKKHCLVVSVDACEIFDRTFCKCGFIDFFQEAFTLTVLDRRLFAPPIENASQRFVNMANTCETFRMNPPSVAHLINQGFNSITLLSMAKMSNLMKRDEVGKHGLRDCLEVLNDRRATPLEPLHSLKRLIAVKRKRRMIFDTETKCSDYLDLAGLEKKKKIVITPCHDYYKQPQPMIAKSTFLTTDAASTFGCRRPCVCPPHPVDVDKARRPPLFSTASSSSGYSSASSTTTLDTPDSPDSFKNHNNNFKGLHKHHLKQQALPPTCLPPPPPPRRQLAFTQPHHQRVRTFIRSSTPPTFHKELDLDKKAPYYCPIPDCDWQLHLHQVEDHCAKLHGMPKGGVMVSTYREVRQNFNEQSFINMCGYVKLNLNAREILSDEDTKWTWGPTPFNFDNVAFYVLVHKKTDSFRSGDPQIMFWIWSALPANEAHRYRYEIHLDCQRNNSRYRHYTGFVQSLQITQKELMEKHLRSIVYFNQSYLRKALRFTQQQQQQQQPPSPPTPTARIMDIKYTVKIMRQS